MSWAVSLLFSSEGRTLYKFLGMDGHTRLRAAERFSLQDRQWELIADMNEKRSDASACSCEVLSRIYCAGGFNGQECLFTAEFYCPLNKIWTQVTPMRSRRSGVSIISTGGDVYAVGGFDGTSRLKTAEVVSRFGLPLFHRTHF